MATPGPIADSSVKAGDRRELAATVVVLAVGGGLGVLTTARTWSRVTVTRLPPLGPIHHDVTGRTLQPAVTGLAVVALAGVLALLATRANVRRAVGAALVLAGLAMVGWALAGLAAVSDARGRALIADARAGANLSAVSATEVTVQPTWVVLAAVGGVLVALAGTVTALRSARWRAMSSRYEPPAAGAHTNTETVPVGAASGGQEVPPAPRPIDPTAAESSRARADLALWQQLDRGEDPTDVTEAVPSPTSPAEVRRGDATR